MAAGAGFAMLCIHLAVMGAVGGSPGGVGDPLVGAQLTLVSASPRGCCCLLALLLAHGFGLGFALVCLHLVVVGT